MPRFPARIVRVFLTVCMTTGAMTVATAVPDGTPASRPLVFSHQALAPNLASRFSNGGSTTGAEVVAAMGAKLSRRQGLFGFVGGILGGQVTDPLKKQLEQLPRIPLAMDINGKKLTPISTVMTQLGIARKAFALIAGNAAPPADILDQLDLRKLSAALEEWRTMNIRIPRTNTPSLFSILNEHVASELEAFKTRVSEAKTSTSAGLIGDLGELCKFAVDAPDGFIYGVREDLHILAALLRRLGIELDYGAVTENFWNEMNAYPEEDRGTRWSGLRDIIDEDRNVEGIPGKWLLDRLRPVVEKAAGDFLAKHGVIESSELGAEEITFSALRRIFTEIRYRLGDPTEEDESFDLNHYIGNAAFGEWKSRIGQSIERALSRSDGLPGWVNDSLETERDFQAWLKTPGTYQDLRARFRLMEVGRDLIEQYFPPPPDKEKLLAALELMSNKEIRPLLRDESKLVLALRNVPQPEHDVAQKPDFSRPALPPAPSLSETVGRLSERLAAAAKTTDVFMTLHVDRQSKLLQIRWNSMGLPGVWCPWDLVHLLQLYQWPGNELDSEEKDLPSSQELTRFVRRIRKGTTPQKLSEMLAAAQFPWRWHRLDDVKPGFRMPAAHRNTLTKA